MNPRVKKVEAFSDFTLIITFDNDERRRFEALPYLVYPAYQSLNEAGFFLQAKVGHGTVMWPNEVDFCPDTLYLESVPLSESADAA